MTPEPCPDFEPLLARAADDTIAPADRLRLDAHLGTCERCRAALADQQLMRAELTSRPPLRARPDFVARVTGAIEADRSWMDRLDFRTWTWRLLPIAAGLSLVTWIVARQPVALPNQYAPAGDRGTTTVGNASTSGLPVATALWDESISDASLLSLMLRANADDTLPITKER